MSRTDQAPGSLRTKVPVTADHDHSDFRSGGKLSRRAFSSLNPFSTPTSVTTNAAITTANLVVNPDARLWEVTIYLEVTAKSANGTVTVTIGWTDANGATSDAYAPVVNAVGHYSSRIIARPASANLTYATTLGTFTGTYTLWLSAMPM